MEKDKRERLNKAVQQFNEEGAERGKVESAAENDSEIAKEFDVEEAAKKQESKEEKE